MVNIYEAKAINNRKSAVVMIFFILFVTASVYILAQAISYYLFSPAEAGYLPSGFGMIGLAFIISGLMSLGGYYYSDKIVLTLSGARPADRKRDFDYYTVSENLCLGSGIPKPKLYVINDSAPNAFATGRDPTHSAVCVTRGLLDKLNRTELEGVIAHELTHIRNYDTRLMSVVSVLIGSIALLGDWFLRMSYFGGRRREDERDSGGQVFLVLGLVFAMLSPIIAQLIQLAISRSREYLADAGSVELTRQPRGLIAALRKISTDPEALEVANKATAHLYIVNPFKEKGHGAISWFASLFNTHPPIQDRIKRLEAME
jgi:heat shock protein HtpX